MSTAKLTLAAGPQDTLWKTLQTFNVTRVVIALVLLAYLSINTKKGFWSEEKFLYQEVCALYLVLAIVFVILAAFYKRHFLVQIIIQIAVDILVISSLFVAAGGTKSGLEILFLFPLAGGAILAPLLLAMFFSASITLILLFEGGYRLLSMTDDAYISQAGLYGAAFFAAAYVINRLAARLIKQEELAVQRGQDLAVQQAINRLVIADMGDGILVVDRASAVLTMNPAAERMLGWALQGYKAEFKLSENPAFKPIADSFFRWLKKSAPAAVVHAESSAFVRIKTGGEASLQNSITIGRRHDLALHLKLRFASVDSLAFQPGRSVIFLQDVSDIENQAQQLKLASMGRLTASIAHEVRNPLSAISYATGLVSEDITDSSQLRLLNIIKDNVGRLNRMIEDILNLSRKAQTQAEPLSFAKVFNEILKDFQQTQGVRKGMMMIDKVDKSHRIWFDPLHLREVIVNLLSNAMRYASGRDGSIRLSVVSSTADRLELHVQDDGAPISPEVRAHLFEPFYTTSSKGTGLGLYLARELCLNNNAMLDYEYRMDASRQAAGETTGRFVVTFAASNPN